MLENIDRLYAEMLIGGGSGEAGGGGAAASREDPPTNGAHPLPGEVPPECADASPKVEPDVNPEELKSLLEETLWSALMMTRGTSGLADVQAGLVRILGPEVLSQCFRVACIAALPSSLSQRLASEMPGLRAVILDAAAAPPGSPGSEMGSGQLAARVRQARDYVLTMACDSEMFSEAMSSSASATQGWPKERPRSAGRAGICRKAALPPRLPPRADAAAAAPSSFSAGPDPRADASAPSSSGGLSSSASTAAPCGSRQKPVFAASKRRAKSRLSYWTSEDMDTIAAPPPHVADKL